MNAAEFWVEYERLMSLPRPPYCQRGYCMTAPDGAVGRLRDPSGADLTIASLEWLCRYHLNEDRKR